VGLGDLSGWRLGGVWNAKKIPDLDH